MPIKKRYLPLFVILIFLCSQACTHSPKVGRNKTPSSIQDKTKASEKGSKEKNQTLPTSQQDSDNILQELNQPLEKEVVKVPPDANATAFPPLPSPDKKEDKTSKEVDFELTLLETKIFQNYFKYYTQKKQKTFQNWLNRAEPYLPYIRKVFNQHGLPQDLIFLPFAESGFNPWAYSKAGAAGLWQFMPETARRYGLKVNWWIDERRDPYKSTVAAAKHLKYLYEIFNDWYLALAAYNAGEGNIKEALQRSGKDCYFEISKSSDHLYKETRYYVPKFMAILKIIRNLKKLDFKQLNWEAQKEPTKLQVKGRTHLFTLSQSIEMQWSKFKHLNPAFRRTITPPGDTSIVYLPPNLIQEARNYLNNPKSHAYAGLQRYQIRSGDSWWSISRRFDVSVKELKMINEMQTNFLKPGQWIIIPNVTKHVASKQKTSNTYTIRRGDTLWGIAKRFNVSLEKLRKTNNLPQSATQLRVGQKLLISGSEKQMTTRNIAQRRANYIVKKGDTLWGLSQRFGVSLQTLAKANGLADMTTLRTGTKLYIPDMSHSQTQLAHQKATTTHNKLVQYQVKSGDSLWDIARKFGVTTKQLLAWNDISSQKLIHPGDEIKIYTE